MSQMMLSQANAGKTLCFTSLKGSEVDEQSDFSASPSSLSKVKASNFPTSLLRIGTRKCVSRYEGSDASSVDVIVCKLYTKFTIKDLEALYLSCGIEVRPTSNGLLLSQQKYVTDILSKHNMLDSKSVSTPIVAGSHLTLHDGSSSFDTIKF
ncbi:hypothetical protein ZIOFF_009503 [Zingiber officinale]|uniref:Reverse transcriptase Ty1/copia-type domain-containing protein n=1 Tax=Zingiber officinale TaxID=94328 RepID=A0A8J5LYA7_ZINOF|nr:hypothetical protein ZIOFF_009503 [Zingiber officinale]